MWTTESTLLRIVAEALGVKFKTPPPAVPSDRPPRQAKTGEIQKFVAGLRG